MVIISAWLEDASSTAKLAAFQEVWNKIDYWVSGSPPNSDARVYRYAHHLPEKSQCAACYETIKTGLILSVTFGKIGNTTIQYYLHSTRCLESAHQKAQFIRRECDVLESLSIRLLLEGQ